MFRDTIILNKTYLSVMIGGLVIFYIPLVHSFPIFYSDDYYIFYSISKHPLVPIALESGEKFFLFLRPITYFYLWLQFHIFSDSAILMKYFGCLINIATIVLLFLTIQIGNNKFRLSLNPWIVAILCMALGLHRDYAHSILWISNINELLASLFYVMAFYVLLNDIEKPKNIFFVLFLFTLSVLSKQQGLHFPILLILYRLYLAGSLNSLEKRNLHLLICGSLFVAVLIIIGTYFIYIGDNNQLLESLWKKPFSIVGTLFYMLFPAIGENVYNYFMIYKSIAFITAIFLITAIIILCFIYKESFYRWRKTILCILLVTCIVFIPRIAVEGGERLNGIPLLWLTVGLLFLFGSIKKGIVYIVLCVLVLQNIYSGIMVKDELWHQENRMRYFINKVLDYRQVYDQPLYIIPSISKMSSVFYKLENNKFDVYKQLLFSDIIAKNRISQEFLQTISVRRENKIITVEVDSASLTYLLMRKKHNLSIISYKKSNMGGYSMVTFELPDTLSNYRIVQFDGNDLINK